MNSLHCLLQLVVVARIVQSETHHAVKIHFCVQITLLQNSECVKLQCANIEGHLHQNVTSLYLHMMQLASKGVITRKHCKYLRKQHTTLEPGEFIGGIEEDERLLNFIQPS